MENYLKDDLICNRCNKEIATLYDGDIGVCLKCYTADKNIQSKLDDSQQYIPTDEWRS